jgi:hypothetical protein
MIRFYGETQYYSYSVTPKTMSSWLPAGQLGSVTLLFGKVEHGILWRGLSGACALHVLQTAVPAGEAASSRWAPAPHWAKEFKDEWKFRWVCPDSLTVSNKRRADTRYMAGLCNRKLCWG